MRNRMTTLVLVAGMLALGAGLAQGAGFSIYEANSKATALGCAFTATADDGSAVFYNVAGLSFQMGKAAEANVVAVAPSFAFTGKLNKTDPEAMSYESENKVYPVPGLYYSNATGEKFAYGIGVYAPFGLGVVWEDGENWIGNRVSHDVQIQTIYVTPAFSYLVTPKLSIGAGVDITTQHLKLQKYTPEPTAGDNAIHTTIEGRSKINLTPVFGVMYRPTEKLSFGANYHFKKTMKFEDGDADLEPLNTFGDNMVAFLGASQKLESDLNLPDMLQLGVAYQFVPKFRGEFNYVWFGWSTFESLELDFENPDFPDQLIHFNYEDSWQIRFGFTYEASETIDLMAGFVRDNTPQPLEAVSPLLPDTDRSDYSFGVLWKTGGWELNASYMFVHNEKRTNIEDNEPVRNSDDYPFGSYKAHAHLVGVGAAYHF